MENVLMSTFTPSELKLLIKSCLKEELAAALPAKTETDRWMNIQELCEYLPSHPSQQTIYQKSSKREIPAHKQGRQLMFLKSEIDAWLKNSRRKTLKELGAKKSQ